MELNKAMADNAGKSLLEKLWEELDSIMGRLMDDGEPDADEYWNDEDEEGNREFEPGLFKDACKAWGEERGQAQGVAYAIAIITNPYAPNVNGIKVEAYSRWKDRQNNDF